MELLGALVGLALAQDGEGLVIDGDDTHPAALGRPIDTLARDHGCRSGDGDLLSIEVDVFPPQLEQLATARSGVRAG